MSYGRMELPEDVKTGVVPPFPKAMADSLEVRLFPMTMQVALLDGRTGEVLGTVPTEQFVDSRFDAWAELRRQAIEHFMHHVYV